MFEIFSTNIRLFEQSQNSEDISAIQTYAFDDNNPAIIAGSIVGTPITDQELRDAGYLLAIDYGAQGDGITDDAVALQNWIDAIKSVNKVGYLHYSDDAYITSKALGCFNIKRADKVTSIAGTTISMEGGRDPSDPTNPTRRPVIKLASGSLPVFDNVNDPCPIITWGIVEPINPPEDPYVLPDNPLDMPSGWQTETGNLYSSYIRDINLDTNQHAGAIGMHMPGAQRCMMANVKVIATNSAIGISCWPSTNYPSMNVEIIGGDVGVQFIVRGQTSAAGELLCGIKIDGATVPINGNGLSTPAIIIGLEVLNCPGTFYTTQTNPSSNDGMVIIIDARIEITGGGNPLAFNNPGGENMYLENVWVTGTDNIVKSGSANTITRSGTWKKIEQYVCTNQDGEQLPYQSKSANLINGVYSTIFEPATSILSNDSDPTSTRRTKHNITIPSIDDGQIYIDAVEEYNVAQGIDSRAGLQAAIDAAEVAGHNRVFLRKGNYDISEASPGGYGIKLKPNTQLFGMWAGPVSFTSSSGKGTFIRVHDSWAPTTGQPVLCDTTDTTTGIPSITNISFIGRGDGGNATRSPPVPPTYERFGSVKWRSAGGFLWGVMHGTPYYYWGTSGAPPTNVRHAIHILDNGAIRIYGQGLNNQRYNNRLARGMLIEGPNTGAIICYGHNWEVSKAASGIYDFEMEVSCEAFNADNIVIYGQKKEGRSGCLQVTDGNNIAFYGGGVLDSYYPDYFSFYGDSDNLLVAASGRRYNDGANSDQNFMVVEDLDATPEYSIPKREQVMVYKRGSFDLDAIYSLEK